MTEIGGRAKARLSLEEQATTLGRLAERALRHYEVWRVYTSPDTRPRYIDAMDDFPSFFGLDEDGHRSLAILALAAFFDKDERSVRLSDVFRAVKSRSPATVERCENRIQHSDALIKKVLRIRHGAIAHRTNRLSYDAVFSGAGLTADELGKLVENASFIATELASALNIDRPLLAYYVASDLNRLLERLSGDLEI